MIKKDEIKRCFGIIMNSLFVIALLSILLFHVSMYNTINYYANTLYYYKYIIDKDSLYNCSNYTGDAYFTDCAYKHLKDTIGGGCLDNAVTACYYAWNKGYSCSIEMLPDLNHSFSIISFDDNYCVYDYGTISCRKIL